MYLFVALELPKESDLLLDLPTPPDCETGEDTNLTVMWIF